MRNEESPSKVKEKIHKQYDEEVREVLAGKAGYIPCKKSPLSKSCSDKFPPCRIWGIVSNL